MNRQVAERRKQRRLPVRIGSLWKSTSKSGMGHVSNLSVGGCRVTSGAALVEGDQTVLTMYFGQNGSMTLQGRVVSIGANGIGIKFEKMTGSLEYQINEVLASLR
ncbi:MAG TPA: PilZ domain-containing protein [Vicinamibacterales bacterium]|nr:PilZ domain-containing protein [Vicinamibacterales bacterium]